jgi:hypothetical protein
MICKYIILHFQVRICNKEERGWKSGGKREKRIEGRAGEEQKEGNVIFY